MRLHPAIATWFARRFPSGPTEAQARGWEAIARGQSTLIAAPTGSGKTLAGFLVCIDRLYRDAQAGPLPAGENGRTRLVYVSPLKALGVDIEQNLKAPLEEIALVAREIGLPVPQIRIAVRSGDTEPKARAAMLVHPPDILITTPESLYLLLTAEKSRERLSGVRTLIVDEIHALARDKRGAHLALSLERLEHLVESDGGTLTRIGLSATQRPIELIARLLCGVQHPPNGNPRFCEVIDTGHRRKLDLAIELPETELAAIASMEQLGEMLDSIAAHVLERRTTLVFVNTRRLAERVAHLLAERIGEDNVSAHHGSLSKERRLKVEARLRSGELRAVVATASLELGIDVGPVELVCQLGSPRSIATFLQRVGRSGHSRFGLPVGRLYPQSRDELVECVALLAALRRGELDATRMPAASLDVLAQQIVAECAAQPWDEAQLFECLRRAGPYSGLTSEDFEAALALVSDGVQTGRGVRGAYVQRDRVNGTLKPRRAARISALTSGGAIPEMADYRVLAEPGDTLVGTVNEDFAIESMAGDVFLLGTTAWRIVRVERGVVRVVDARGATPTVPFWLGEAPGRTFELSRAVSALREELDAGDDDESAIASSVKRLSEQAGVSHTVALEVTRYLGAARASLGALPTQHKLVVERFFDDTGGMQLVIHSAFGARVNRALGLLVRKRFCTSFDFELQAAANDDAVVLSLGPQHSFLLEDFGRFLRPHGVRSALEQAVLVTPMFAARWRYNLGRALIVLRMKGGKKNPPQIQRMEADDVMAAVFPALAQCQDNAQGPRAIPDHVLVRQTLEDCFTEAMDLEGLERLLAQIEAGQVQVLVRENKEPSLLAHEILNGKPYTFLDDAPLEERRTRAVSLPRGLPASAAQRANTALDPSAIDRVRAEQSESPRDPDELHDLLMSTCVLPPLEGKEPWIAELVQAGRARVFEIAGSVRWCAVERMSHVRAMFPEADLRAYELPAALAQAPAPTRDDALVLAVRGHLELLGPTLASALVTRIGVSLDDIEAAVARLELEGSLMRGAFDPRLVAGSEQLCARRLFARISAYSRDRLRREIEPVSAQDLMRFYLEWQHVTPASRLYGPLGLLQVISQLEGFELPAAAWEHDVLARRVADYEPDWLDGLCLSGQVVWGRWSSMRGDREDADVPARLSQLSRATPVALVLRKDAGLIARACRRSEPETARPAPLLTDTTHKLLEHLRARGASFADELAQHTGASRDELRAALWDGVARGAISADGFAALRNLIGPSRRTAHAKSARALRAVESRSPFGEGRWALLPEPVLTDDPDTLAERVALLLLARYGVLVREVYAREPFAVPYRELNWALRRLEARGVVRGGHFVSGLVGEHYALPEALEALRRIRKQPHAGERIELAACDPLNLTATLLKGPRIPAKHGLSVEYVDGAPVVEGASLQA